MSRRVVFLSLCSVVFVVNMGRVAFAPLLEPFMATFGIGPGTAGLVTTLLWVGATLPSIGVGYLLTKLSQYTVITIAGVLLGVASAATAASTSVTMLAVGAFVIGVSASLYFTAANPLLSSLFPEGVGRAIGIHGAAMMVASVAAPLYVGVVLVNFVSWRYVFGLLSAFAIVTTVAFRVTLRRNAVESRGAADETAFLSAVGRHWRLILTGVLLFGVTGFVWQGVFNFFVTYLVETKSVEAPFARNLLSVVFFAGIPSFWLSGRIADRFPKIPATLTFLGVFVVSMLSMTAVGTADELLVASVVMGFSFHGVIPIFHTYVLESLPEASRSSAFSIYLGVNGALGATGSVAVGAVVESGIAFDEIYRFYSGVLVAVMVVSLVLYRYRRI
jgi:predicted MFS family arabinose efflux permease